MSLMPAQASKTERAERMKRSLMRCIRRVPSQMPGSEPASSLASSGQSTEPTKIDDVPFMKNINRLGDFNLMVLVSAGAPGAKEYVQYVQAPYALRMVAATTAVSTTDLAPYYQSGQLLGLVAGLSGAAEYEALVGKTGTATQGADVLNVGHGVVILAIILGNSIYFLGRRRRRLEALV